MAELLRGAPVAAALDEKTQLLVSELSDTGVVPCLAILRAGERPDDLAYENAAAKRCARLGIGVLKEALPQTVTTAELLEKVRELNDNSAVHGILLMRPLPRGVDEKLVCAAISPQKDVDGVTGASLAGVFADSGQGFPPCTARSCIEMLDYYNIETRGKKAAVIGRSLVIGRPVAAMLLSRDATVAVCHSKTADVPAVTRQADIVVAALGKAESVGAEFFSPGQTVLDVGMSWSEEKNRLCGDVAFEEAEKTVAAVTPVPGGVGTVTTAVLALQVAEACKKQVKR
ncbi:MAG: bifunctional 5,10-methylenetetrahydrofolate dehydrogenase/5,10-methenyltetrahydrofolate cyclohydrolase [Oscillospiraceae bacterium]|nr:bifunctional 5,10-methylenetetrahydrofolate dehydrogenase/5,10-methenyltetrahydrofolate cyclohydrolase [Oscillospiraceae bacterium]